MIYDCFSYWDEDLLLDLRLNILDKYVDYFVISESTKNHQGKDKKINFNIKNLIFDPGFGYGKTPFQNLKILSNLEKIKKDRVLLAGLSQKKFLKLLFETKENHLNEQSLTAGIIASLGGANILRVHQVKETVNLLRTVWPK